MQQYENHQIRTDTNISTKPHNNEIYRRSKSSNFNQRPPQVKRKPVKEFEQKLKVKKTLLIYLVSEQLPVSLKTFLLKCQQEEIMETLKTLLL